MTQQPTVVIVSGTAGTGKSTVGEALIAKYKSKYPDVEFVEGDSIHPPENIAKMTAGIPLQDEDRWGWLKNVSKLGTDSAVKNGGLAILTCSSLKKAYRDLIRETSPNTKFVWIFLYASRDEILNRLNKREGHFMKANMMDSQFNDLQLPESAEELEYCDTVKVDNKSIDDVVDECVSAVHRLLQDA